MTRSLSWLALFATAAFLMVFLLLPLFTVLAAGLRWGSLVETIFHPVYQRGFINSVVIGFVVTALSTCVALPLAAATTRYQFSGKRLAEVLLLSPMILPPFVGAIGVSQLFGQFGMVNSALIECGWIAPEQAIDWLGRYRFAAVCALETLHLFPILYLLLAASFARIDAGLIEAAQGLGAGRLRRWKSIVVPLLRPGLAAGILLVFVWSFTELGTPLMLGYDRVTPVQIFSGLADVHFNPTPFSLVVIMLVISAVLSFAAHRFARGHFNNAAKEGGGPARVRLTGMRAVALWFALALVIVPAILPHIAVVLVAVAKCWYATALPASWTAEHIHQAMRHPQVIPGIRNSLAYAGMATVIALIIGTWIAWMSTRWKPVGWRALDALAMLPLAIPGIILAFGYLGMTTRFAVLKEWLDPLRDPTVLLIIAYAVRRLPHVVRASAAGLNQAPVIYEEAAASLGAGPFTRFRRITVPLIASSLLAGAVLTFSFSMLEVSDSLILAQKREFFPVTKVIFELVQIIGPGPAIACAFSVWAMLFLAAAFSAAALLGPWKKGQG
jgi:iron(III) transport system permease protein